MAKKQATQSIPQQGKICAIIKLHRVMQNYGFFYFFFPCVIYLEFHHSVTRARNSQDLLCVSQHRALKGTRVRGSPRCEAFSPLTVPSGLFKVWKYLGLEETVAKSSLPA